MFIYPAASSSRIRCFTVFVSGLSLLLLAAAPGIAQQALPITSSETLVSVGIGPSWTVDLSTIPNRPVLVVDVTPMGPHADIALEVELSNWVGTFGSAGGLCFLLRNDETFTSPPATGPIRFELELLDCNPTAPPSVTWAGETVDVSVRATSFGSQPAPAEVIVSIRGETRVPNRNTDAEVETSLNSYSVSFPPSKDTTIYQDDGGWSNGAGSYLWAGQNYTFIQGNPFSILRRDQRRPLIAFDLGSTIAPHATVTDANLFTYVVSVLGGGGAVSLYALASDPLGTWDEGSANAFGSEFIGTPSATPAANWLHRSNTSAPWSVAGGDGVLPLLGAFGNIAGPASLTWSSSQLTASVQSMVSTGDDEDGFILYGPGGPLVNVDRAVRFASGEYSDPGLRPRLDVDYDVEEYTNDMTFFVGSLPFINEGENFRWIYDLDDDDIYQTPIGGVCEATPFSTLSAGVPHEYEYNGPPGYVGLDCCTWQIESPSTGTTGTGQVIYFHNLDPTDPANFPEDTDGDGIADICDNCMLQPNGPAQGTCISGSVVGGPCNSDLDCAAGGLCHQSQQDADRNGFGDVCPAPEPGLGMGLLAGVLCLGGRFARRARPST